MIRNEIILQMHMYHKNITDAWIGTKDSYFLLAWVHPLVRSRLSWELHEEQNKSIN